MSTCLECNMRINTKQNKIKCKGCSKDSHLDCISITQSELDSIDANTKLWLCHQCKAKVCSSDEVTLKDVLEELRAIRKTQNDIKEEQKLFRESMEKYYEELSEVKNMVQANVSDIKASTEKIALLEHSVQTLSKENIELKMKINEQEQYSRGNCLEITGVPQPNGECTIATVQQVCAALGHRLDTSLVDSCYRLKANPNLPNQPKTIMIKFTKKSEKDKILELRKVKRDFLTANLDTSLSGLIKKHNTIYVNESLTLYNKYLYAKAKQFKRENNIKYLWIKGGNIYMKKSESSTTFVIKSNKDFINVK